MELMLKASEKMSIKELVISNISRNFYGYLKQLGAKFYINEEEKLAYQEVEPDQEVKIVYYGNDKQEGIYSYKEISVLYEDSFYIVIDKPAHLLSIPSANMPSDSVFNRLLAYFKDTSNTIHIVNRLDKETKGLMLICKSKLARASLKKVDKIYYATTSNRLPLNEGTITDSITKTGDGILRAVDNLLGDRAITHYKLIDSKDGLFTYEVKLETGRTHQIRVHFSHYHCPLIGDTLYGGIDTSNKEMGLVCKTIVFFNPFTKKEVVVHSNY